jgi:hypothetical protein
MGVAVVLAGWLFPLPSRADLLPPSTSVAGKSQNDWAEAWWDWAANIPGAMNPVLDRTGTYSYLGDQGDVFFLAGVFGGGDPINRTVTVTNRQHLFFPLLNAITWDAYSAYPDDFERDLIETIGDVQDLYADLNGVSYGSQIALLGWLQQSPDDFPLNILAGGFFNETGEEPGIRQAQQRGYYLMLEPLPIGTHTLRFGGRSQPNGAYADWDPNIQNITYTVRVTPEPSSVILAGLGILGVLGFEIVRRRRFTGETRGS